MTHPPQRSTVVRSAPQQQFLWFVLSMLLSLLPLARPAIAAVVAEAHSSLVPNSGEKGAPVRPSDLIRDEEFAVMMKELLLTGDNSNVRDAKFLFQECYGGGMLKHLQAALGNQVSWVGGSASKEDEESFGEISVGEDKQLKNALLRLKRRVDTLTVAVANATKTVANALVVVQANQPKVITLADVLNGIVASLNAQIAVLHPRTQKPTIDALNAEITAVRNLGGLGTPANAITKLKADVGTVKTKIQRKQATRQELLFAETILALVTGQEKALQAQEFAKARALPFAQGALKRAQDALNEQTLLLDAARKWQLWALQLEKFRAKIEAQNTPLPRWTRALKDELEKDKEDKSQTLRQVIVATAAKPTFATVQVVTGGKGEAIKLKDPDAASHHAILWAGRTDFIAMFHGIEAIRKALEDRWGKKNVSIQVLFGDGEHKVVYPKESGLTAPPNNDIPKAWGWKAATRKELKDAIENVKTAIKSDANEQFFFYASDHGSRDIVQKQQTRLTPRGGNAIESLALPVTELAGILDQPDNEATLTLAYTGNVARDAVSVTFNGEPLGTLVADAPATEFVVPEDVLRVQNEIRIHSENPVAITIDESIFSTGAIGLNPARDCNRNGDQDSVDVIDGSSRDQNDDGIPDECR